jgi:hypothetical protein
MHAASVSASGRGSRMRTPERPEAEDGGGGGRLVGCPRG